MRAPRAFLATLSLAASAAVAGIMVGYFAGATGGVPLSTGIIAIMGLMLTGLLTAFYSGRLSARGDRPPAVSQSSWDAFRRELDRARRFERPFALLRITDGPAGASGRDGSGALAALPLVLRSVDQAWAVDGSLYVVLPESTGEGARQLVSRLRAAMPDEALLSAVEMVEFPTDGVTTGALLANLRPVEVRRPQSRVRLVQAVSDEADEDAERTG